MTKQAELKKQAYTSNLKSRALSILIYLIDRSNQDLTCFPAIPTMAEQLHISVSTVKRALKELVEAGFIQKDARFREKNRGQSSNLYTLVLFENVDNENNLNHEDTIKPTVSPNTPARKAEYITFENLKPQQQKQTKAVAEVPEAEYSEQKNAVCTPVHLPVLTELSRHAIFHLYRKKAGQMLPCKFPFFSWTGAGVSLQPP